MGPCVAMSIACVALSGCTSISTSRQERSVSFRTLSDESRAAAGVGIHSICSGYDEACVVLIRRFYPQGHVRWYHALSLANVSPYKTTVHLEGVILRSLMGDRQPGDAFIYVETWHAAGRARVPDNHPVGALGVGSWMAPEPAIMAVRRKGTATTVALGRPDSLPRHLLIQSYIASLHAFIDGASNRTGHRARLFATGAPDAPPSPPKEMQIKDIESFVRDCILGGHAPVFSCVWSHGDYCVYARPGRSLAP